MVKKTRGTVKESWTCSRAVIVEKGEKSGVNRQLFLQKFPLNE